MATATAARIRTEIAEIATDLVFELILKAHRDGVTFWCVVTVTTITVTTAMVAVRMPLICSASSPCSRRSTVNFLPLASASTDGCTFSVVYATSSGGMTASAPAYNSGWATEIALDVQWVHATAPMARIVLIEAPDSGIASIANAVALANAMGPGVVSLSLGANEGSWVSSVDSVFYGTGMSYAAATGDNGKGVMVDYRYADGAAFQPKDDEVAKLRPAN